MSILPYLETFAAVVEKGSFTVAAEALNISKPVVSKRVSQLEQHLGVQLLHRTTRRLHLTEAGEVFARYAQRIVEESTTASFTPKARNPICGFSKTRTERTSTLKSKVISARMTENCCCVPRSPARASS